jgi:hypothetical protein
MVKSMQPLAQTGTYVIVLVNNENILKRTSRTLTVNHVVKHTLFLRFTFGLPDKLSSNHPITSTPIALSQFG